MQRFLFAVDAPEGAALARFLTDESGQDLIEYALIAGLVALGTVAAVKSVTTALAGVYNAVGTTLTTNV
jgi:pilus assembly protein Flp/PilA